MKFNNTITRLFTLVALLLMLVLCMSSVTIKSGATTDVATVDTTSKAVRVTRYDTRGNATCQKATYSVSTLSKTAVFAGTAPFFQVCGSGTKTIRVQHIRITATVATAAVYGDIAINKRTTISTGGTPLVLIPVAHDSTSAATTATNVKLFTAAPTAGSGGGAIATMQDFLPLTGTVASEPGVYDFDWTVHDEQEAPVLRGAAESIEVSFATTTTNAPTITVYVEYTEE